MARIMAAVFMVAAAVAAQVGWLDTIGGTTYDWQGQGPAQRMYCNAPYWGRHALWMYSADTSATTFPDRNMRYNFFDHTALLWNWIDPDFMASGVNVYAERSGFGNLGVDPQTGVAVTGAHQGSPLRPSVARDMAPGAGIFEFCPGPSGYQWPIIAVGGNGWIHCAMIDNATQDQVWYSRCTTWCQWEPPRQLSGTSGPDPGFPNHNIAASFVNRKVCVTWQHAWGEPQESIYYRVSTDGGTTWGEAQVLPMPPAYGPDTLPSLTITSPFPYYDRHDRLHFVVDIAPIVRDTMYIMPAEIWHWCGTNTPQWSRVHRAECLPEHLQGTVGYNATYACRASIGEDPQGNLLVAWEQFDSSNVEPRTNLLRAGIWVAASFDTGMHWYYQRLITERNTVSHRFPCIVDYSSDSEFHVLYMDDLVAGFVVQGQGPATFNPIVAHRWDPTGIEEAENGESGIQKGEATLVRGVLLLAGLGHNPGRGHDPNPPGIRDRVPSPMLLDAAGRRVMELRPGANDVSGLAPGVYFVLMVNGEGRMANSKVVLTR